MKNLPDEELFDQLGSRLRNYHEEPDELVWKNISIATQSKSKNGLAWVDHTSFGIALAALLFFLTFPPADTKTDFAATTGEQQRILSPDQTHSMASAINGPQNNNRVKDNNDPNTSTQQVSTNSALPSSITAAEKITTPLAVLPADVMAMDKINWTKNRNGLSAENRVEQPTQLIAKASADSVQQIRKIKTDSVAAVAEEAIIPDKKKKRSFNFYIALSPSLNYRQVTPLPNDNVVVTQLVTDGVMSGKRLGFALETGWQAQINPSLELFVGLSYYHQNQTLSYRFSNTNGNDIVNTEGPMAFKVNVNQHTREVSYQMNNIGLQAGVLYLLKAGPLTQKVGAGLWYQHGLSQQSDGATYNNAQSGYLAYQILYRNEYAFSNYLRLYVQPNFTQSFNTSESLNEPFKLKPYSVGLSLGIIYTLQRK